MNNESLADMLIEMIPALSDVPGTGLLAFIKSQSQTEIRKLALCVASRHPSGSTRVYVVQGGLTGEHAWPFSRIRKEPRIFLSLDFPDGVTETGGLIFPQDRPIVLLAEDFDYFDATDQRAYCQLVDGEGHINTLHQGSVLLCSFTGKGEIESGSISRGYTFELEG